MFHDSFSADVSAEESAFMADSQVPWGVEALGGTISEPAWRSKPPPAKRSMSERAGSTVVEDSGSHAIYVSRQGVVADLIRSAVRSNV